MRLVLSEVNEDQLPQLRIRKTIRRETMILDISSVSLSATN